MAKKSFARKAQRTIVGAAKSSAARVQKIAVRAATAAATAAAEAAVDAVMRSFMAQQHRRRGLKTATKRPARGKRRSSARTTSARQTSRRKTR